MVTWARTLLSTIDDTDVGAKGEVQCMRALGDIYRKAGRFDDALEMFEAVIQKANAIGDRVAMVNAVVSMAHALFKDHQDKQQTFPPSVLAVSHPLLWRHIPASHTTVFFSFHTDFGQAAGLGDQYQLRD